MKTIAFVSAKGTSERIKNKNTVILDGEYLFKRKLIQLLDCEEIDEVWLDSECDKMHDLCTDIPVRHYNRPAHLASNDTDGHELFANFSKVVEADIIVQALCTAPLLDKKTIDPALKKLKEDNNASSLVFVKEDRQYTWKDNKPEYGDGRIPNSKDLDKTIIESMSFYAVKVNNKPVERRFTDDVILYPISDIDAIDIDNPEDLSHVKHILSGRRLNEIQQLKGISKVISSCLLSDLCKENNINHFLSKDIKSLNGGKFLGYAKTLKLKALEEDKKKEWKGIFSALDTYDFIEPGDVIVVSSDIKNKAYFGDLNATFAHRRGAVGVVVDGQTRDVERVSQLGLPVFAHGQQPDDIRFEGTFESMNKPVYINQVKVSNNDIIYGDSDGVVCIPKEKWPFILDEVKKSLKNEMLIKLEASFGAEPWDILNNIGLF